MYLLISSSLLLFNFSGLNIFHSNQSIDLTILHEVPISIQEVEKVNISQTSHNSPTDSLRKRNLRFKVPNTSRIRNIDLTNLYEVPITQEQVPNSPTSRISLNADVNASRKRRGRSADISGSRNIYSTINVNKIHRSDHSQVISGISEGKLYVSDIISDYIYISYCFNTLIFNFNRIFGPWRSYIHMSKLWS